MSLTDEIKQRLDIIEVIGQYTPLTRAGRTYRGLCPFHSEKHPSFFVYPERQSWHCFGACNTGGDVFAFVMKKEGLGFGDALRMLAERAGVAVTSGPEAEADRKARERLYQANRAAADYFHETLLNHPGAEKARNYLAGRGVSPESTAAFKLGYSLNSRDALMKHLKERDYGMNEMLAAGLVVQSEDGDIHDRFRNKIMFPIIDTRERVTGFGARVLDDSLPKYINSPQTQLFDKSSSLYGIHLAREAIRQQDRAVIVEGYMDVIAAHQYGFAGVVAPMGISLTEKQMGALKKMSPNVILALDADSAGEEAMLRGTGYENVLEAEVRVMLLPAGKDPDEVIKQDRALWEKLMVEAVPVLDYAFDLATTRLDLSKARDKTAAVDKLLPVVAGIKDPVRQAHYLAKLASHVKVAPGKLETSLQKLRGKAPARSDSTDAGKARRAVGVAASPLEEYCLALLLQNPALRETGAAIPEEYFENSENREIYLAYRQSEDIQFIRENTEPALREYLDSLAGRSLPQGQLEQKLADCLLRLRERSLRNQEAARSAMLQAEREMKGAEAELTRNEEEGTYIEEALREVFHRRGGIKEGGSEH